MSGALFEVVPSRHLAATSETPLKETVGVVPGVTEIQSAGSVMNGDSLRIHSQEISPSDSLPTPPVSEIIPSDHHSHLLSSTTTATEPQVSDLRSEIEPVTQAESTANVVADETLVDLDAVVGAGTAIDGEMDAELAAVLEGKSEPILSNGHVVEGASSANGGTDSLLTPVSPAEALALAQQIPEAHLPDLTPSDPVPSDVVAAPSEPIVAAPPPIGAAEPIPPPPITPLPVIQHPALARVDSVSSTAAQPPTPAATVVSAPSVAAQPIPLDYSHPLPTPTPAPITPAVQSDLVSTPMDVDIPPVAASAESPVLKRSAPLEDEIAAEGQGEAKRQRVESETLPFAAVASAAASPIPSPAPSTIPTPVHGYDPTAFTSSAPVGTPTPASPVPTPTISPASLIAPPPASTSDLAAPAVPSGPIPEGPVTVLTKDQHKWALQLVRTLKKNRQAPPFLRPVDPVALLIPDYFRVVTRPMDLGTVETKLMATGKAMVASQKRNKIFGLNYSLGVGSESETSLWEGSHGFGEVYRTVEDFKEDVERVWENCYKYNGPKDKNPVSAMAGALQEVCEKMFRTAPYAPAIVYTPAPPRAPSPVYVKPEISNVAAYPAAYPAPARREESVRPKRETQVPARVADQEEGSSTGRSRPGRVSNKSAQEQLRFCKEVMKEMFKKSNQGFAFVFYEPVDYVALNIPQYPSIIRKPIDLGTIRAKLDNGEYPVPPFAAFEADMRLLFKNCYAFNPPGTAVHTFGSQLENVFEHKWHERPVEDYDDESDDEQLHDLERQIITLQNQVSQMKQAKANAKLLKKQQALSARPPKPKKQSMDRAPRPTGGNMKKQGRNSGGGPKRPRKKQSWDGSDDEEEMMQAPSRDAVVTFEMKRELAVKIVAFEGDALEKAIDIIRNGRPDLLGDASKEIELDIDQLDQKTLLALYRYVCPSAPRKQSNAKPRRQSNSGGPKRKTLDEMKESERIEALEARLREFEGNANGADSRRGSAAIASGGGDQASSDSSSEEGSESESEED